MGGWDRAEVRRRAIRSTTHDPILSYLMLGRKEGQKRAGRMKGNLGDKGRELEG